MNNYCKNINGVFMPNCIGGAVYGKQGCTCTKESKKDKIRRLQKEIELLKGELNELKRRNTRQDMPQ